MSAPTSNTYTTGGPHPTGTTTTGSVLPHTASVNDSAGVSRTTGTTAGSPTHTTGTTSHAASGGQEGANAVKHAWGAFHGAGEAIRGNVNSFIDGVGGDKAGAQRDAAIAQKGESEIRTGHFNPHDIEPTTQTSGSRKF